MAQEIEVKFALTDRPAMVERIVAAGGEQLYPETFEDNIVLDRRGELRTRGALLRVRKFGRYVLATYKGPVAFDGAIKFREEVQTGLESFERAIALFDAVGFKPVFRYQKFREVWRVSEAEVVLDRTPIGEYLEIEGPAERIREIAGALGLSLDAAIRLSYADLYRQQRRVRGDLPENMVFDPQDFPTA
ncbi:MAG TPA: class IV adenylate cyclase [Thermoanaerobaculia bacterium]|nr:class IV adenylate cyclase [Thermoanaerobaculia bacterium]